jgi:hypothetical protein
MDRVSTMSRGEIDLSYSYHTLLHGKALLVVAASDSHNLLIAVSARRQREY